MGQILIVAIVLAAGTLLSDDIWWGSLEYRVWKTKFAWLPVVIYDSDGDRALLWLEKYEECRVDELQIARRCLGGKEYVSMCPD